MTQTLFLYFVGYFFKYILATSFQRYTYIQRKNSLFNSGYRKQAITIEKRYYLRNFNFIKHQLEHSATITQDKFRSIDIYCITHISVYPFCGNTYFYVIFCTDTYFYVIFCTYTYSCVIIFTHNPV